jgi:hypothetical protein
MYIYIYNTCSPLSSSLQLPVESRSELSYSSTPSIFMGHGYAWPILFHQQPIYLTLVEKSLEIQRGWLISYLHPLPPFFLPLSVSYFISFHPFSYIPFPSFSSWTKMKNILRHFIVSVTSRSFVEYHKILSLNPRTFVFTVECTVKAA